MKRESAKARAKRFALEEEAGIAGPTPERCPLGEDCPHRHSWPPLWSMCGLCRMWVTRERMSIRYLPLPREAFFSKGGKE